MVDYSSFLKFEKVEFVEEIEEDEQKGFRAEQVGKSPPSSAKMLSHENEQLLKTSGGSIQGRTK